MVCRIVGIRWLSRSLADAASYVGHVMADCYSGNMSVVLAPGSKMTRMACMSHARRHIYEHQDNDKQVSVLPLALMNQLYDIERRGQNLSDEARGELRSKESRMILDRLATRQTQPCSRRLVVGSRLPSAENPRYPPASQFKHYPGQCTLTPIPRFTPLPPPPLALCQLSDDWAATGRLQPNPRFTPLPPPPLALCQWS
ncbi:MAG: transposase, partial [Planctomycetota bacterium]|nr:transposase [Planctomycetota bacterium]